MTEEWRMELIGPQEAKESWHTVTHTTLADYTGSKPCTLRPHLLSRPKKNMGFLLFIKSVWRLVRNSWKKKKKSFPWLCHPVCTSPATCFKPILFPLSSPEPSARNDTLSSWHSKTQKKKGEWGKTTSAHRMMIVKRARAMSVPFGKKIYIGQRMTANKY